MIKELIDKIGSISMSAGLEIACSVHKSSSPSDPYRAIYPDGASMKTDRTLKQAGLALRAARLHKDMRQAELSRLLGVDRTQVALYETGNAPVPPSLIEPYARVLDITPSAFRDLAIISADLDGETN